MINEKQWYYDRAHWEEKFALIPRRCDISNRWLWGRHSCGTVVITGPGEPVVIRLWNHREEHIMYILKGKQL